MVEVIISSRGYFQKRLKDGYCFIATTGPTGVGEGDIKLGLFDTGSTTLAQILRIICACDQARRFRFCENPTVTDNGSQQSARNMRIGHTRTPGSSFYKSPTVSAEGSVWADFWVKENVPTNLELVEVPWALQANKTLLMITSGGAGMNASITVEWEESW
jgi:hypothetical protein